MPCVCALTVCIVTSSNVLPIYYQPPRLTLTRNLVVGMPKSAAAHPLQQLCVEDPNLAKSKMYWIFDNTIGFCAMYLTTNVK